MSAPITMTGTGTTTTETRERMEKLYGELSKKQLLKLPRLLPPEIVKRNPRGPEFVTYELIDKQGDTNIVNHYEMTELHSIAEEIRNVANAASAQRAAAPIN